MLRFDGASAQLLTGDDEQNVAKRGGNGVFLPPGSTTESARGPAYDWDRQSGWSFGNCFEARCDAVSSKCPVWHARCRELDGRTTPYMMIPFAGSSSGCGFFLRALSVLFWRGWSPSSSQSSFGGRFAVAAGPRKDGALFAEAVCRGVSSA